MYKKHKAHPKKGEPRAETYERKERLQRKTSPLEQVQEATIC
jgi:hypothetical protein